MEKEKPYQPTEGEIKKAEEMMTDTQREASEGREETLKGQKKEMRALSQIEKESNDEREKKRLQEEQQRIEDIAKKLKDKLAEEAEKRYSPRGSKYANWGGASNPRILDTAKGKIIAIPVHENRDHGVDPSVTEIHFFDSDGNVIKTVKSNYKRTAANFYNIYPTFKKEGHGEDEIVKIEYIQSKHIGFDTYSGHQYKKTVIGKEDVKL